MKGKSEAKGDSGNSLESKWGKVTLSRGWIGVPNVLVEQQRALGITPIDVSILLVLMKYWWDPASPPYPSKRVISEMLGREESTIRKRMAELEKKGLITRDYRFMSLGGQTSNRYVMDGLMEKLEAHSKMLNKLEDKREQEDASIRRGAKKIA